MARHFSAQVSAFVCVYAHICVVHVPLLSIETVHRQKTSGPPNIFNHETLLREIRGLRVLKEASVIPLTHTHKHTNAKCKDKAEAAMAQHASFTLHLLWSTEKTQTAVCVTQYGPLSISSTSAPPPLRPSLRLPHLSCGAIVRQYNSTIKSASKKCHPKQP